MSHGELGVRQMLREWIEQHAHRPANGGLRDDTPILEQRIITSLQVMELILLIQKTTARRVDVSQLKPCSFRSIDNIYTTFFAPHDHALG
jgi:hypothetical protein